FATAPERVLDETAGAAAAQWLVGARLNIAQAALAAAEHDPRRVAVITAGEEGALRRYTIAELNARVQEVAKGLLARGLSAGDAIAIDMPMTIESVAIYLAIVHIGAT